MSESLLWQWVRGLDEAAIADWANKGLVKRGAKTLAAGAGVRWTLEADAARADIEGYAQRVDGVGFSRLACDCPAFGPCHHLCAFLLGLRARLAERPPSTDEVAAAVPPARPWLAGEADALERALGAAAVRRALHWQARGIVVELTENEAGLHAHLAEPDAVTVRVPRAGGLAASTCSCKAAQCAHRALTLLQARVAAAAPVPQASVAALEPAARIRIEQLDDWLSALVLQGSAGIGAAFVDQGEALATELRQADLPRLGASLQGLVGLLRELRAGRGGAAERLPAALAAVWVLARGLRQTPLPRPYAELAGAHRRTYRRMDGVRLHGVAVEVWTSPAGQRGFSVHFHAPELGRYFSWSESRARDADPQWQADAALLDGQLAGVAVTALLARPHRLVCGWASEDGRLSVREGTCLSALDAAADVAPDDLGALARALGERTIADPWRQPPPRLARLAVGEVGTLEVDRALRRWSLPLRDPAGRSFVLRGGLDGFELKGVRKLQHGLEAGRVPAEVCGRIASAGGGIVCAPLSVRWRGVAGIQHLNAPWLRVAAVEARHA